MDPPMNDDIPLVGPQSILQRVAPFIPDTSQSPAEHAAWLREMAVIKLGIQPRSPAPLLTLHPAERDLRAQIAAIGTHSGATPPFLAAFHSFAKEINPLFSVHEKPIMFTRRKQLTGAEFESFGSISSFANLRPANCNMSLALVVLWTKSPPPITHPQEFINQDFSAVVMVIIHPEANTPKGTVVNSGRALLVANPNIAHEHDNQPFSPRLTTFLKCDRLPSNQFLSLPRPERSTQGTCLTLALEWMLEMVVQGFQVSRDSSGTVVSVDHYRKL
ncbi:hypothetical protein B0H15DRAFT_869685 [Mycena belliarum]|uniref:Uncharacterized protein n=1 Tax=Mycena belliarum TaxID=1033014 RepID=A0AAD6TR49_9AGAR|nr:hypothetical protein B0H15DRAFT_869685 [Mycena belliae]